MTRTPLWILMLTLGACGTSQQAGEGSDWEHSSSTTASADHDVGGEGGGEGEGEGEGEGGSDGGSDGEGEVDPEPGQLTAGEWRDLDQWGFWLDLVDPAGATGGVYATYPEGWGYNLTERLSMVVHDDGAPAVDVAVTVTDGTGDVVWVTRTDNHGRAEFFPSLFDGGTGPWSVEATDGWSTVSTEDLVAGGDEPVLIELAGAEAPQASLDLMFVIDTTGSMGDELGYLKSELADTIDQVRAETDATLDLRLSVNFYRDEGDDYVVRAFPFTDDVDRALDQLSAQSAGGGGDYPEAVEAGLYNGVFEHDWSERATSRVLFLLLDAPPHETQGVLETLHETTREAAALGIRIIPIAASGVDVNTEFLLRSIDIATGGTYTFVTDDSGIGDSHLEPTVGAYNVEYLNDMLVRLITASMAEGDPVSVP